MELPEIKQLLIRGIGLSGQMSYGRRAPKTAAIPFFRDALRLLRERLSTNPNETQAWKLLAQAHECLLAYGPALVTFEKYLELSGSATQRDLKKVAQYRELCREWHRLGLTPAELAALGDYLRGQRGKAPAGGDRLFWTRKWLAAKRPSDGDAIIDAFWSRGAFDDFQVLQNIVGGSGGSGDALESEGKSVMR